MHRLLIAAAAVLALAGCTGHGSGMHGHGYGMHGMQRADAREPYGMRGTAGAPICGESMMSAQERDEHHRRMREASTAAERDRIRQEHHDAMIARARERGIDWRDGPGCRASVGPN